MPPYIGYIGAAELGKWVGHSLARLGATRPRLVGSGISALEQTHAAWPTASRRGFAEVHTASARIYLASGDLDQAADHAAEGVSIATATESTRNLNAAFAAQTCHHGATTRPVDGGTQDEAARPPRVGSLAALGEFCAQPGRGPRGLGW
ncbi:hypothetical protein ACIQKB_35825 [Streptomyces sp. NPDC092046]|uniref:hypothetical protein n=1 Tax=Streptomyces sp. NPDC092046 TaxID=3366009 RepID=UPI00382E968F